jgi:hypothetical protein
MNGDQLDTAEEIHLMSIGDGRGRFNGDQVYR